MSLGGLSTDGKTASGYRVATRRKTVQGFFLSASSGPGWIFRGRTQAQRFYCIGFYHNIHTNKKNKGAENERCAWKHPSIQACASVAERVGIVCSIHAQPHHKLLMCQSYGKAFVSDWVQQYICSMICSNLAEASNKCATTAQSILCLPLS